MSESVLSYSIAELKLLGWTRVAGVSMPMHYPPADHIVMAKDGKFIQHIYSVRDDDSDYPTDNQKVNWREVKIVHRPVAITED